MRNFSGSATEKFLTMVDGREVLQMMGGTINWTTEDMPLAILDRVEIIRGPGASIWGTNAVSGVINVSDQARRRTQGNSVTPRYSRMTALFLANISPWRPDKRRYLLSRLGQGSGIFGRRIDVRIARPGRRVCPQGGFRFDKELAVDLDLTIAGGFATRRVEHVLDLSYRLFYINNDPGNAYGQTQWLLPSYQLVSSRILPLIAGTNWAPFAVGGSHSTIGGVPRYQNYEDMPQDASHIRANLSGITNGDLEWSLSGYAELYDTSLGHIGHSWEREEYAFDFKANKPIGDFHHLAFGLSARHMSFRRGREGNSSLGFPHSGYGYGTG